MNILIRKKKKNSFYILMGVLGLFAVCIGFFSTYIVSNYRGVFRAPVIVHVHGALAFSWTLLFLVQAMIIRFGSFALHRTLGYASLFIAIGIVITLPPVGKFQVEKELLMGQGETAVSQIIGVITTAIIFGILVGLGFWHRKKPKIHKRLLLLATIVLLWPAWFRFRHYFPMVPKPEIWFAVVLADSLIIMAWIADWLSYKKIHPTLLFGGLLIIAEQIFELLMFDNSVWRKLARLVYSLMI